MIARLLRWIRAEAPLLSHLLTTAASIAWCMLLIALAEEVHR